MTLRSPTKSGKTQTASSYDLIVTDLKMPDMNGYRLAIAVKIRNRPVKVVIMTVCPENDCTEMMGSGWVDFQTFWIQRTDQ